MNGLCGSSPSRQPSGHRAMGPPPTVPGLHPARHLSHPGLRWLSVDGMQESHQVMCTHQLPVPSDRGDIRHRGNRCFNAAAHCSLEPQSHSSWMNYRGCSLPGSRRDQRCVTSATELSTKDLNEPFFFLIFYAGVERLSSRPGPHPHTGLLQ